MKHLIAIFCIVQLACASLNYGTGTLSSSFSQAGCAGDNKVNSPVLMAPSLCAPYSHFKLTLTDVSLDQTAIDLTRSGITGGPTFAYDNQEDVLEVNGTTWETKEIVFRSPAEHRLAHADETAAPDFEMQILLAGTGNTATQTGQLSFLLRIATNQAQKQALGRLSVFSTTAGQVDVKFANLVNSITKKLSDDVYLNLLTYDGTLTYPTGTTPVCTAASWYIYGSELYIDADTAAQIQSFVEATTSAPASNVLRDSKYNSRLTSGTGGGSGEIRVERLCYTGYFRVTMGDNYGLWFGVSIIFFFFVLTLIFGEKPITDPEYRESTWTHHPFVSLYKYGNELHTRKSRSALFMATLSIHGMFSAIWYENCDEDKRMRGSNTIVYGVYSMLISIVVIHMVGCILRKYYLAKYQFHKTRDEKWDQRAQNRIFAYYFTIFFITVVGWSIATWKMNGLHAEISNNSSRMWVASFFIGLGLEWLIIDPLMCLLARSIGFFNKLVKLKGYMYDNKMHETYMLFLKMD